MTMCREAFNESLNEYFFYALQKASGSLHFRELPFPREWSPINRPHIALLLCEEGYVFRFYLSTPCVQNNKLNVSDPESLSNDSIVEVKYNDMDFRYYRRDENMWAMVGEARNPEYEEFNNHGIFLNLNTPELIES